MKCLLIITIVLFTGALNICSQSKQLISLAFYSGAFFSGGDVSSIPRNGFSMGLDFEARNKMFGMYGNFTYDFTNVKETIYNSGTETKFVYIIEAYMGPRWFIGRGKLNGLIDLGLGYYKLDGEGHMGLNIGAGLNYGLSKKIDLSLKSKYHVLGINFITTYAELSLGLRYNFSK